jgi:hypothetical protein
MRTVLLATLSVLGCAASSVQPAPPLTNRAVAARPPAGSSDDEIRLAVFRYLLDHNASAAQRNVAFVCLTVYDGDQRRDPSPFIMTAMSSGAPRAVLGSACENTPHGVFLKDDHAQGRGLSFHIEQVEIDGDKATVTGGYYEGNLSASGNVYTVERQPDGRWKVTGNQMQWIS